MLDSSSSDLVRFGIWPATSVYSLKALLHHPLEGDFRLLQSSVCALTSACCHLLKIGCFQVATLARLLIGFGAYTLADKSISQSLHLADFTPALCGTLFLHGIQGAEIDESSPLDFAWSLAEPEPSEARAVETAWGTIRVQSLA